MRGFVLEKIDKRVSNRARYFYTNIGALLATLMIVWGASSWGHVLSIDLSHISMRSVIGFVYLVFGVGFVAVFLNIYMIDRYGTMFSFFNLILMPVFALLLDFILFLSVPNSFQMVGAFLVLIGLFLIKSNPYFSNRVK